MNLNLEEIINKIIQNTLFLKLKDVVENNSYHDHEDVYSHLIKTKNIAQREISGKFITNPEAKKLFLQFISVDFHELKKADTMILIALLHDVGKMLSVKEDSNFHPILVTNSSGITSIPGHEYWSSTIVEQFFRDVYLEQQVIVYITDVIRLHDTFNESYWPPKKDWPIESILNDVKSRAEDLYKEVLFNIYCDCFTAKPFKYGKEMIIKIFNEPDLYIKREYVIA